MFGPLDKLGSPPTFYRFAEAALPWLGGLAGVLIAAGLVLGLGVAPPDYQQGEVYRIIYIHVPAAWLSLLLYSAMAVAALLGLVWRMRMTHVFALAAAPVGACFTLITLVTGSIWGKPTWGTWWSWDARLTSELILLFMYLGFIALQEAMANDRLAWRSGAVLLVVGWVNIPIIHYSVEWWHTLHQPASILRLGTPALHSSMLIPLLTMAVGLMVLAAVLVLQRMQAELLRRHAGSNWLKEVLQA